MTISTTGSDLKLPSLAVTLNTTVTEPLKIQNEQLCQVRIKERSQTEIGYTYTSREILSIRNALKFSSKLLDSETNNLNSYTDLSKAVLSAEVGVLLALSKADYEIVVAGFLYAINLNITDPKRLCSIEQTIANKFGNRVLKIIQDTQAYLVGTHLSDLSKEVKILACAIKSVKNLTKNPLSAGSTIQIGDFESGESVDILANQKTLVACLGKADSNSNLHNCNWTTDQICKVREALHLASVIFMGVRRNWGLSQTMPLCSHLYEVGLIAILSDCAYEVVVAAFLHDAFEGYSKSNNEDIRGLIFNKFGTRVIDLIEAVTEPAKQINAQGTELRDMWFKRKLTVLDRLSEQDVELAELFTCSKISTIAAGNKTLWDGGTVADWSKGTDADNNTVFIKQSSTLNRIGVKSILIEQLDVEISKFILLQALNRRERLQV